MSRPFRILQKIEDPVYRLYKAIWLGLFLGSILTAFLMPALLRY